jgi:type III restriction enzyme
LTDAADTDEKRAIGALWEKASSNKGVFLMPEKQVDGKDVRQQLLGKVR